MFEAMMNRFQEDSARHLFRMQIIGPDGTPIETPEQMLVAQTPQPVIEGSSAPQLWRGRGELPQQPAAAPVIPTRAPSTTIDAAGA